MLLLGYGMDSLSFTQLMLNMKFKNYWDKFKIVGFTEVMGSKNGRLVKIRIPTYKLIK